MFNLYADVDARSMTPSRITRSYTLRSVPSSPGRSFFIPTLHDDDEKRDGSESVDPTLGKASSHATVFLIQYLFIIGWEVWKQNFCPSHLKAFKWEAVRFICIKISAIKQSQFENFKTLIFHCKPTWKQCIALYIALHVYIAMYTVQYTCIYCNILHCH